MLNQDRDRGLRQLKSAERMFAPVAREALLAHMQERRGLVAARAWLRHNVDGRPYSLPDVAAELAGYGYVTPSGQHHSASAVASMLGE
jgi:hypothetical protein